MIEMHAWLAMHFYHAQPHMAVLAVGDKWLLCPCLCLANNPQQCCYSCCSSEAVVTCLQDTEALQQQVALLKLAAQDGVVALQKQLANAIAERDVAHEQIRAAEQQAAAETALRVRLEGSAHDVQQQLSRQTAEAGKAQQACKKLHEQVNHHGSFHIHRLRRGGKCRPRQPADIRCVCISA